MEENKFIPLRQMAAVLGVPAAWLREEVNAGRVSCLRAGRRLLFKPDVAERELTNLATKGTEVDRA